MRQGILRDRHTGIEHRNSGMSVHFLDLYLDNLFFFAMVDCIGKIVHQDFFDLEFIAPDIDLLRLIHMDGNAVLLRKKICGLQIIVHKCRDIKALHRNNIVAGFELVERQKLFDHVVHLRRFVHNDVAVKLPALRIGIDVLQKSLRIALDQCDRRF